MAQWFCLKNFYRVLLVAVIASTTGYGLYIDRRNRKKISATKKLLPDLCLDYRRGFMFSESAVQALSTSGNGWQCIAWYFDCRRRGMGGGSLICQILFHGASRNPWMLPGKCYLQYSYSYLASAISGEWKNFHWQDVVQILAGAFVSDYFVVPLLAYSANMAVESETAVAR